MADVDNLDFASLVLIIVGAINWGLEGLGNILGSNLNVVELIFSNVAGIPILTNVTYLLVGLAGLYQVYFGYQLYEEEL